jgi:hypothetical protein
MPRFYFHIDDDRTHIDRVGVELPDLQAARDEAVSAAGQILRNGAAKNLWAGNLGACGLRSRRSQMKSRFSSFGLLRRKNDGRVFDGGSIC